MAINIDSKAIDAVLGEAGGESEAGKVAVIWVIRNRMLRTGKTAEEVVTERGAFDGLNNPGPAARRLWDDQTARQEILDLFNQIESGGVPDPTGGAEFFHAKNGRGFRADEGTNKTEIGGQVFYSLDREDRTASAPMPSDRPSALRVAGNSAVNAIEQATSGLGGVGEGPLRPFNEGQKLAPLSYDVVNQHRNQNVNPALERAISESVTRVYGPEYTVQIRSGGENDNNRFNPNTRRHATKMAADVLVFDESGRRLSADEMTPIAQHWLATKQGSIGFPGRNGTNFLHMDFIGGEHENGIPLNEKEGLVWYYRSPTPEQRKALEGARDSGGLPEYRGPTSSNPRTSAAPIPRTRGGEGPELSRRNELAANDIKTIGSRSDIQETVDGLNQDAATQSGLYDFLSRRPQLDVTGTVDSLEQDPDTLAGLSAFLNKTAEPLPTFNGGHGGAEHAVRRVRTEYPERTAGNVRMSDEAFARLSAKFAGDNPYQIGQTPLQRRNEMRANAIEVAPQPVAPIPRGVDERNSARNPLRELDNGNYTVKRGDNLSNIAEKFYGNKNAFRHIAAVNKISNPNRIRTGQVLDLSSAKPPEPEPRIERPVTPPTPRPRHERPVITPPQPRPRSERPTRPPRVRPRIRRKTVAASRPRNKVHKLKRSSGPQ